MSKEKLTNNQDQLKLKQHLINTQNYVHTLQQSRR